MKIFLSYPSVQQALASRLALALEAEGHVVFIDRADLQAGEAFHQHLRDAIAASDAFVFLVTPESVAAGSYALAELDFAQAHWRRPSGHVLPVVVTPTPIASIPAYLTAVTLLQPQGDLVAETVAAVAKLETVPFWHGPRIAAAAAVVVAMLAAFGYFAMQRSQQRAESAKALEQDSAAVASANKLCQDGSHEAATSQLNELATHAVPVPEARTALEDCAMLWLRNMHATVGKQTFSEQVAKTEPILVAGLARSKGQRAADIGSHIGWGEYLRGRDGATVAHPETHWKRALVDDESNVYAHSMWARAMLDHVDQRDAAKPHFATALAGGREIAFVRTLQLGGSLGRDFALDMYAVTVADDMRKRGEPMTPELRNMFWNDVFGSGLTHAEDRATLVGAMPAHDLLETFTWLFPQSEINADRLLTWRFDQATLLANSGDSDQATAQFQSLLRELRASKREGSLKDESQRALDRLQKQRKLLAASVAASAGSSTFPTTSSSAPAAAAASAPTMPSAATASPAADASASTAPSRSARSATARAASSSTATAPSELTPAESSVVPKAPESKAQEEKPAEPPTSDSKPDE